MLVTDFGVEPATETTDLTPILGANLRRLRIRRGLSLESGNGDSRVVERIVSGSDDDLMTREYRSGDALRRVGQRSADRNSGASEARIHYQPLKRLHSAQRTARHRRQLAHAQRTE